MSEMREDTCPVHGSYYATVCPGCWEELTGDVSEPPRRLRRGRRGVIPLKDTDPPRYNGGIRCDMLVGPCSCGAWHSPAAVSRSVNRTGERRDGVCCSCGYDGTEETTCEARTDRTHCEHWWDGAGDGQSDTRQLPLPL